MRNRTAAILAALTAASPALAFDGAFKTIPGGDWDVDQGPVPYVLEPNGSADIDDGSDLDALRAAFRGWQCVEGVKLRFEEQDGPGPATVDLEDGQNSLFWDETGDFGLGPATLGVTVGDSAAGQKRRNADIVFNGFDSSWSTDDRATKVDVGSIAAHEIGHFLGLDHPCDGDAPNETNCNGADRSIMTPVWSGAVQRTPLPDDEEGVRSLYPAEPDDTSTCDGPFRKGERCSCDDECVAGLVCASVDGAASACAGTCASDHRDCGAGFVCVFDAPEGDEPAPGVCVKSPDGQPKPPGAICSRGSECASGTCNLLSDIVSQVCQVSCDSASDCSDGGTCFKGFCLGAASHEACPAPEPQGCGCGASSSAVDAGALLALAGFARFVRRRRRRRG